MKRKRKTGLGILLKRNISKGQLIGYSIANLVGLTVILSGILFYCDSRHHLNNDDKYFSDDYIVISKKVKGINLEPISFTTEEINEISRQPWVKKLGRFTPADFRVNASLDMGGRGMSTYLFFESVPDEFFDTMPSGWDFDPKKKFIPIVLNKDYLALYNFGFALPRGLPQLSEEMIGTVPLRLLISGDNGKTDVYDAAIVGFSSRLNTIAVPQSFMEWANSNYGNGDETDSSRLIIKIDRLNPSNPDRFLSEHGYETAGDKEGATKVSEFMGVVSGVVSATGFVISLLAFFILLLSIFLLLQKNRKMLHNLLLLGYSPRQASRYYERIVLIINLGVTLCAVGFSFISRLIWHHSLKVLGLGDGNVLFMLGAAAIYFLIVSGINIFVIRRHILLIWNSR